MSLRFSALAGLCLVSLLAAEPAALSPRPIGSHSGGIASTHFSPDGSLVASGGGDKVIRVWDVKTGKELHTWKGPSSFTCVVRFSPDGKTLAAAGYESGTGNAIYRFNLATGKELPRLAGHATGGVRRLLFTPDNKRIVSGGFDGFVRVWDVESAKEVRSFKTETGTVYGLALSPDGRTVATAGRDGLRVWDVATGREQPHDAMNKHNCVAVTFSPDGKMIASGDNTSVTVWELATGKDVMTLKGFKGEVSYLIYSADGRTLFTSSYDKMVRMWEVRTGRMVHEVEAHGGWVWGLALTSDEKRLASCSVDGHLKVWELSGLNRPSGTAARLSKEEVDAHWKELAGKDAGAAYRSICVLASDPSRTLPLLGRRLLTVRGKGPTAGEIAKLIHDLDSDEWEERERATEQLARMGARTLPALKKALAVPPSLEARKRLERLVAATDPTNLPAEDLVTLRGVQVIEYIGTEEARSLLERLARNPSGGPRLVEEASLAVRRLKGGSTGPR